MIWYVMVWKITKCSKNKICQVFCKLGFLNHTILLVSNTIQGTFLYLEIYREKAEHQREINITSNWTKKNMYPLSLISEHVLCNIFSLTEEAALCKLPSISDFLDLVTSSNSDNCTALHFIHRPWEVYDAQYLLGSQEYGEDQNDLNFFLFIRTFCAQRFYKLSQHRDDGSHSCV